MRHVNWEVPSDIHEAEKYSDQLKGLLEELGWKKEAEACELAFREAILNAIIHGNLGMKKDGEGEEAERKFHQQLLKAMSGSEAHNKKVHVSVEITPNKLSIAIQDHGDSEQAKKLAKEFMAHDPTQDADLLKTSGRGGLLIQNAFGEQGVRYFPNELGMKLVLTKERQQPET